MNYYLIMHSRFILMEYFMLYTKLFSKNVIILPTKCFLRSIFDVYTVILNEFKIHG
jgi:hypothetical protein